MLLTASTVLRHQENARAGAASRISPGSLNPTPTRYDLMACNLVLASISALLMAAVGSSVKVVQILQGANIAGLDIDLGLGAAVNPGVLMASVAVFFSMTAALLCVIHNRFRDRTFGRSLTSVCSWLVTIAAFTFFILTLALVPVALAVEVGL